MVGGRGGGGGGGRAAEVAEEEEAAAAMTMTVKFRGMCNFLDSSQQKLGLGSLPHPHCRLPLSNRSLGTVSSHRIGSCGIFISDIRITGVFFR